MHPRPDGTLTVRSNIEGKTYDELLSKLTPEYLTNPTNANS